jgi:predicted AAA+ superfamily ATPase
VIKREISELILRLSRQYPVVTITGPRQSGKTTLCKLLFPKKPYISLENIEERNFAINDPKGFLAKYPNGAILDEIQKAPDLLSYIQTIVDDKNREGIYILTGSHQFEMMKNVSQSLAGRTAIVKLLPLSYQEAYSSISNNNIEEVLFTGFYPRIVDKKLSPTEAMSFYVSTYIERDLRELINIKDLSVFENFLKICAGRSGQIINYSSIGNDCGISYNTIKNWLSILETSFIIKIHKPFFKNINKRLVKSPKLYFLDTGLLCYLLGITDPKQIETHPLKGAIFESFIVSDILKIKFNKGKQDNLYYYRDNHGIEIDILMDQGTSVDSIEIKSSKTLSSQFFKNIKSYQKNQKGKAYLIYGGNENHIQENVQIVSWNNLQNIIDK